MPNPKQTLTRAGNRVAVRTYRGFDGRTSSGSQGCSALCASGSTEPDIWQEGSCYESASAPNVSVTSWVSMYSRTSWIKPSSNRKNQQ
jgi:hypothetical protein